jgi:hypothetical protein
MDARAAELPGSLVRPCSPSSWSSLLLCSSAARGRRRAPAPVQPLLLARPDSTSTLPIAPACSVSSRGFLLAWPRPASMAVVPKSPFLRARCFSLALAQVAAVFLFRGLAQPFLLFPLARVQSSSPLRLPWWPRAPHLPLDPLLISLLLRACSSVFPARPAEVFLRAPFSPAASHRCTIRFSTRLRSCLSSLPTFCYQFDYRRCCVRLLSPARPCR